MRPSDKQIEMLAEKVWRRLKDVSLVTAKVKEAQILEITRQTIENYYAISQKVDNESGQLMDQYAGQIRTGQADPQQMYRMIRKQVAQKYKFELSAEEQVNQLSHRIQDRLYHDDLVDYTEEDKALRSIKDTLKSVLQLEDLLDTKVREKILSLKRGVKEGSREWDLLYRQYMDEERNKRRF